MAVAAQGLAAARPTGKIDMRHLRRVFDAVGVVQIDSVNVLVRSQELPLFSRLGAHPRDLISRATASGELFEYWCHEASHIPVRHHHLSRWRMEEAKNGVRVWSGVAETARKNPGLVSEILSRIESTPDGLTAGDVRTRQGPKGQWWDWDDGKAVLEWLFWTGQVTARRRDRDFARVYLAPSHAFSPEVLAAPVPDAREARRELLLHAARCTGVATASDLFDYHRQRGTAAREALASLVHDGSLEVVSVQGWREPAYVAPAARIPRTVRARALLSPFDSLVWCRPRIERLFGFTYRIEIYTPAAKRMYGYYVLPFLLDDRLVARVDAKADRARGVLSVPGAFSEPETDIAHTVAELAAELWEMAGWLGLAEVEVGEKGDLSSSLRKAVRRSRPPT
ncbi:MAG: winged helix-turn-helix domain-containing protein [Ilumatobacteraceae bacterium]